MNEQLASLALVDGIRQAVLLPIAQRPLHAGLGQKIGVARYERSACE